MNPVETPLDEAARLRRCLNDLIGIMAMPALWADGEPKQIADALLDALSGVLRPFLVFVRLHDPAGGPTMDFLRLADPLGGEMGAKEVVNALNAAIAEPNGKWRPTARIPLGATTLSVALARLGFEAEAGVVVVGSELIGFPDQTARLLLDVAANQAVIGLQQARLLSEQRRVARELDERVAQRTSQLAAAHEQLKQSEYYWRLIVDNIPGMVALLSATGGVEVVNRQLLEFFGQTLEELREWGSNGTVHPEDLPHVAEVFSRSIATGAPYEILQRFRRADGVYRWFTNSGFPLRSADGRIDRWCVLLTDIDERKRAEEALRESEHASRLIVDSIPGLITVMTPEGEFERVSLPFVEYFGRALQGLRQWATDDAIHQDDRANAIAAVTEALSSGDLSDFQARFRRFDGAYRWFHVRGLPLRDRQGRIVRWYFLNIDVDERKQAEEALKSREHDLKLIIDTIPALVWCNLPEGPNEFLSASWHDYTGLAPEESHGWGWQASFHPDDLPPLMKKWGELLVSGEPGEIEARLRRHDGVYRWFLIRTEPFRDDAGNVVRWYGTSTDIEDLKRAEQELLRKEALLTKAQTLSSSGSFSWRFDTEEVQFSDEAYRIFEFEIGSRVTVARVADQIEPEDRAMLAEKIQKTQKSGGDQTYEIRLQMPGGAVKYLRASSQETLDKDGRREYFGAVQDVTARRLAEESLDRARSELAHVSRVTSFSAVTASIAHEINQPLSGIITNASTCLRMLNANPPNVDGARETARRTIRDGNRVSDVIARLRTLFSKKEFTLEPVDLNDTAREVLALSSNDFQRRRVAIQSDLDDGVPLVIGDRIQLQQVILNLLRNALDAMADLDDGRQCLLIKTESESGGSVRLSVRDAGVGLDGHNMDRIFDSFYTTKSGGMGIGLSVSRSIIDKHQGRLWAENNEGPGATFAFSIPAGAEGRSPAASPARNA